MFINLNWKTEKKPNTQTSFLAVFCHVLIFERKVNFMVVLSNIKHKPCLNNELSLFKCTFVWNIVCYFCFRGHLCAAPCNEFQNYWSKSLQWNMRKHLFLCGNITCWKKQRAIVVATWQPVCYSCALVSKCQSRFATENCMLSRFVLLDCENHLETERWNRGTFMVI